MRTWSALGIASDVEERVNKIQRHLKFDVLCEYNNSWSAMTDLSQAYVVLYKEPFIQK